MKVLLDTHALLWAISGDARLSAAAASTLLDQENRLFISMASLWEITIKLSLGKLKLLPGWYPLLEREMAINGISWLAIEPAHCLALERLPFHHRDPFDRMLVAQSLGEDMVIVSRDTTLEAYGVPRIW